MFTTRSKHVYLVLHKETSSLVSKTVCSTSIHEMTVQNKRAVSAYFARCTEMWRTNPSWQRTEIFGVTTWSAVSIWQVEGKDGWILQCTGQPPATQTYSGASLVAQWIRLHQPMQGTQVWSLVQEGSTCWGATKSVRHTYWNHVLQLLKAHMP